MKYKMFILLPRSIRIQCLLKIDMNMGEESKERARARFVQIFVSAPLQSWPDTQSQLSPSAPCLLTGKSTAAPAPRWFYLVPRMFSVFSLWEQKEKSGDFSAYGGLPPSPQGSGHSRGGPHVHVPEVQPGRRGRGEEGERSCWLIQLLQSDKTNGLCRINPVTKTGQRLYMVNWDFL